MPSSDSEDFESADEGRTSPNKKDRKKRNSSSNYSDNLESDLTITKEAIHSDVSSKHVIASKDGWEEFDIEEEPIASNKRKEESSDIVESNPSSPNVNQPITKSIANVEKSQDTGWDDFDDWGDEGTLNKVQQEYTQKLQSQPDSNIKDVTDRLAATSTKSDSWGWGWGVDTLLSTATAGITTLTNQVSQGISTVLETSIGAPDPEELAKQSVKENDRKLKRSDSISKTTPEVAQQENSRSNATEALFPFGSLLSGVTKFVETTGTKVIAGGLDTLETIGKKTMEVLQDGDPGLAKKRAIFGLDSTDTPVLSQVLREAKAKAEEEDLIREQKKEAKEVHYESLFDDFEGLVHLEALEMLSRQVNMRIEERIRSVEPSKRQDIKETLQQVAELCEMPDEEDEDDEESGDMSKPDALHDRLLNSTRDVGLKMQYQPLVKQYSEILDWLSTDDEEITDKAIYKRAVSSLAQATALAVEVYHKTCEMLLVKSRRSTADEADALTQMTVVLTKHISDMATLFTERLNSLPTDNKEQINTFITNMFLEAGNSSKYIQNAFQLALPIIQIGAV